MSGKLQKYEPTVKEVIRLIGGKENIQGAAHCATRLRIVTEDQDKISVKDIEQLEFVKGAFIAGDQLQIIFGAGTVNDVYKVFQQQAGMDDMSLSDVKGASAKKQNAFQRGIKALSDVFVQIIPGLLAAALLMGITGLLSQPGVFGEQSVVDMFPAITGINRFIQIMSTGIFTILPLLVVWSATKRFGGNPVLGLVIGAIMLHPDLGNAYAVASGDVDAEMINILGLNVELVGFQGGIIVALLMGLVVAKLDNFFTRVVPDMIKLFLAPFLTVTLSGLLLFIIVGPIGRFLAEGLTSSLLWATENLGVVGFVIFAGVQQVIVITGLHHVIGAVEAQLIADTGLNFIMPLMSVALMGQGGAVLGYLYLRWHDKKARQIGISSFGSILFGISEPALFGINVRYKFPLIAGCLASAIAGAYVFFLNINALGFGATAVPGIAIVSTTGGGHLHYVIANVAALALGAVFTAAYGKVKKPSFDV
ncbi:PTS transporter subunit EIIC [Jeotgalibacillus haloalkalitolerans]|uniref:PTS transporter subunit EIIC n=1 Tax=Jeotgalibacillus haloalkalitolerans TaxID=3104292 RepID=A0ABU5KPZ9_9BACL|nr:PTS transporter subunit EIIC [Jeotgalibacillus sp. HH7-29]MDZ5713334.1 PTS transporter subunit EIIC [Jeotgalibacillus sp. HH7-29]